MFPPYNRAIAARRSPRPRAFTLVELLVVIAIIGVLSALMLPGLYRAKGSAWRADCLGNLRQMSIAAQLYWQDNNGNSFAAACGPEGATNNGQTYWIGWIGPGKEGTRAIDFSAGALHAYLRESSVRLCPSFRHAIAAYKPKAIKAVTGYGYNLNFSPDAQGRPFNVNSLAKPSDTALFGDAAQINDFLYPASRSNPMLEEWYFLSYDTNFNSRAYYPNGHFRHQAAANVVFADGHSGPERMLPGSLDRRLPAQHVGMWRGEILQVSR